MEMTHLEKREKTAAGVRCYVVLPQRGESLVAMSLICDGITKNFGYMLTLCNRLVTSFNCLVVYAVGLVDRAHCRAKFVSFASFCYPHSPRTTFVSVHCPINT